MNNFGNNFFPEKKAEKPKNQPAKTAVKIAVKINRGVKQAAPALSENFAPERYRQTRQARTPQAAEPVIAPKEQQQSLSPQQIFKASGLAALSLKPGIFAKLKTALTKPRGAAAINPEELANTPLPLFFRLSSQDQMLLIKRLAIMLKAGVPIVDSLKMIAKQNASKAAVRVIGDLTAGIQQGQFLYSRLEKFRKSFGDFAVNIIRVGEVSGTLHENLSYLADEIKKKRELKRKVVGALVYPIFIVVATIGITVLLTVYIFPKILPVLQSFKGQLPFTTRVLIFTSHLLASKGWLIVLVIAALVAAWVALLKYSKSFAYWVDNMLLKIPILGRLFIAYHMANFCRTLGILLKSDVRVVEATTITSRISTNLVYKKSLEELSQKITRGEKIAQHLEANAKIFPAMVCQMITVGESTGKLSDSLMYLAEVYENEVDDMTKNLSTSIEPILMIFMGLLVGFIAMSIITPIYGLTQSLSNIH